MAPCGGIAAAKMAAGLVNCSLSVGMTLRLDDLCFTSCSPISLTFLSHVSVCHLSQILHSSTVWTRAVESDFRKSNKSRMPKSLLLWLF